MFCSYGDVPCPPVQAQRAGGNPRTCCKASPADDEAAADWVNHASTFALAWGLPAALIVASLFADPVPRGGVWTVALIWMGVARILNAQRSGRTHCRFTGPYYLTMVIPVLLLGSGAIEAGFYGWIILGALILGGSKIISWLSERVLGRYPGRRRERTKRCKCDNTSRPWMRESLGGWESRRWH